MPVFSFHTWRRKVRRSLLPYPLVDIGKPTLQDVTAGITVAVVALPLALAFGIASGATAAAGIYAAIFGGLAAAIFGGSKVNISGPTGAMSVVLIEVTARHGLEGMVIAGVIAGLLQIGLGLLRAGRLIKYLPHCLIAGFTTGIAVVIFMGQVSTFSHAPLVGAVTAAVMIAVKRLWPNGPAALAGLLAGVTTNAFVAGPTVSGIPQSLPHVQLPLADAGTIVSLVGAGVTICLLGSIEGLLSATVADNMVKGRRHNSDKELVGQGVGNLASALVGGVPITGAIARTSVAVKSGARTPWTAIIHSLILMAVVLAFAPLAQAVPLAALAAVLMVTSVYMVEWESVKLVPSAPAHYTVVFVVTLLLTVLADLTIAVVVGFAVATILFALRISREPLKPSSLALPETLAAQASVHTLSGPLFFGVAEHLLEQLERSERDILILDMRHVSLTDATGALMLQRLHSTLKEKGRTLIVYGLPQESCQTLQRLSEGREIPYILMCAESELPDHVARAASPALNLSTTL